ncbi:MAG: DUF1440 domain-containing protein [Candidatus Sulfotelmatobacter sp.]
MRNRKRSFYRGSLAKTLVAGGIAGLAGACAMSGFARLSDTLAQRISLGSKRKATRLPYSEQEWDATTRIAQAAARRLLNRRLNAKEERIGAAMVHYAVGATSGAAYVVLAKRFPQVGKYSGAIFGAAMWLLSDELLMPSTGTTRKLRNYSALAQANALGEHIVYAVTTDTLLRLDRISDAAKSIT